jgi:hypothetical protein
VKASHSLNRRKVNIMKTLTSLIAGGALTLGTAMAQNAPKPAAPAAPAAQTQTKVKKHRKHHKKGAAATTATPAAPANAAPSVAAPKK